MAWLFVSLSIASVWDNLLLAYLCIKTGQVTPFTPTGKATHLS